MDANRVKCKEGEGRVNKIAPSGSEAARETEGEWGRRGCWGGRRISGSDGQSLGDGQRGGAGDSDSSRTEGPDKSAPSSKTSHNGPAAGGVGEPAITRCAKCWECHTSCMHKRASGRLKPDAERIAVVRPFECGQFTPLPVKRLLLLARIFLPLPRSRSSHSPAPLLGVGCDLIAHR